MTKKELLTQIDEMIEEETNIRVLQSEYFNEDLVKYLYNIKEMVLDLEEG